MLFCSVEIMKIKQLIIVNFLWLPSFHQQQNMRQQVFALDPFENQPY